MVNKSSRYGVLMYIALALLAFLIPSNIMDYGYGAIFLMFLFFIGSWLAILRYMWYHNVEDDGKQWPDLLVYDMIYMLGLAIIVHIMIGQTEYTVFRETIEANVFKFIYYFLLIVAVVIKFSLMRTRLQFFYRFVIKVLFVSLNVFSVQLFFTIWWGIRNLGQGFR